MFILKRDRKRLYDTNAKMIYACICEATKNAEIATTATNDTQSFSCWVNVSSTTHMQHAFYTTSTYAVNIST